MTPRELVERSALLFKKRPLSMWQEIAENFYPQRADFTVTRYMGEEFAGNLYSSYPLLVQRDLSNAFAAMLRPRNKEWFKVSVDEEDKISRAGKEWLEWATKRMRLAMYDRRAQFIRATGQGDADFSAFGQCAISREINRDTAAPHLLYRCWHLRDLAWSEKADGAVGEIYCRWKPTLKVLKEQFGEGALHPTMVRNKSGSQDLQTMECMRLAVSTDVYNGATHQGRGYPWMTVYLDVPNNHVIKEIPMMSHGITLPRWQTVSGSHDIPPSALLLWLTAIPGLQQQLQPFLPIPCQEFHE
jgi:hypothetical protein